MTNEEEVCGMGEVPRGRYDGMHFNGSTKLMLWMLGVFGSVMIVLLTLVLQAVYTTNGAVSELKGQQSSSQNEISELRQEMSGFQAEMMALSQRGNNRGS